MQTVDEFIAEFNTKLASVKDSTGDLSQKGLDHMAFVLAAMPKLVEMLTYANARMPFAPAACGDIKRDITAHWEQILNGEADGTE